MSENTKNKPNNNRQSQILRSLAITGEKSSIFTGVFSIIVFILVMAIYPLKIFTAWRAYKMDKTNKYIHLITLCLGAFGLGYWIFEGFLEFTYTNR
uniref:Uncharacterized protein n=1 Tax=viral metagenome TaxID=1070528 RepID=A0A6C0J8L2_9ZZZZ